MHIWIVNHYAAPPGASGGPSRHRGLSSALRDRGHHVTIHASGFDHYTRAPHRDLGNERFIDEDIDGVRYVWWKGRPYHSVVGRLRNMVEFARLVGVYAPTIGGPPPDVVVGSSPHLLAAWAARRVARRLGVPFVMEVRDLWPQSLIDLGDLTARNPLVWLLARLERSLYRRADHVIVVPPGAGPYVIAHGGRPEMITVIPNGVDLSVGPDPTPPRPSDSFTVVYAGTLGHANGLEVAVEAGRILEEWGRTDVRIRLVGAGPERERLAELLARGGGTVVSIEGPIPSAQVPALLASADACLMILRDSAVFRWGISPTKLFEYLAAARPVIFSVRTPTNLVAEVGAGVTAAAGDPEALARAIVELEATHPHRRAEMGVRGCEAVRASYSFDALATDVEAVCSAVARTYEHGRAG